MLNKPKGFVTTVSDPEGRPTVMKFVERVGVRVFPVGRLDYQSEGLLLMTNDGELANALTRAAAKVEKIYLVKISGKPAESGLNQLRSGIMIERGKPGAREGRVMTEPTKIKLIRDADNPWYEMTLTEGRNREIRKMFEEIGHHVEKIRRVGYGPLVLDVPPGEVRELSTEEVESLRRAATPKSRKPAAAKNVPLSKAAPEKRRTASSNRPVTRKRSERSPRSTRPKS
jgi:23S rRNA pseudouridine2605 synthase